MRRNEFLVSLGALMITPFLPREKMVYMSRYWAKIGSTTIAKRPIVGHKELVIKGSRIYDCVIHGPIKAIDCDFVNNYIYSPKGSPHTIDRKPRAK